MQQFEYDITTYPAARFQELAFFCTESGQCSLEEVPPDQTAILKSILNERGQQGWQLVQCVFGKDGLLAIWKRQQTAT